MRVFRAVLLSLLMLTLSLSPVAGFGEGNGFAAKAAVAVKSVKLSQSKTTLQKGKTVTLKATVKPDNATQKKITWSSSNRKIATVDQKGKVKGIKTGIVTITAKAKNGKKATCKVTVVNRVKVTGVNLAPKSVTLDVGKTEQLKATVKPSNATNKKVTWKSSKPSVASVSKSGKITAKAAGSATITVTTSDGKRTAKCKVTVQAKVQNMTVKDNYGMARLKIKGRAKLNLPKDYAFLANGTWETGNAAVAKVDKAGIITGVSEGVALISVSNSEGSFYVYFFITNRSIPKTKITANDIKFYVEKQLFDMNTVTLAQIQKKLPGGKLTNVPANQEGTFWNHRYNYTYKTIVFQFAYFEGARQPEQLWRIEPAVGSPFKTFRGVKAGDSLIDIATLYGMPSFFESNNEVIYVPVVSFDDLWDDLGFGLRKGKLTAVHRVLWII